MTCRAKLNIAPLKNRLKKRALQATGYGVLEAKPTAQDDSYTVVNKHLSGILHKLRRLLAYRRRRFFGCCCLLGLIDCQSLWDAAF